MDLAAFAVVSILAGVVCCVILLLDVLRNRQPMAIMNIVWPVTALYAGPLALLAYYTFGRNKKKKDVMHMHGMHHMEQSQHPFWQSVVKSVLHCGSGCTLGDILSETILLFVPFAIFGSTLYGSWLLDYALAFAIGIIFQYFAIKPMKHLSAGEAWIAALKADALSLTCWQVGMYGWMAIAVFVIFKYQLSPSGTLFWFMMQAGMLCGFITAFPVNWWLIKKGIKEAM